MHIYLVSKEKSVVGLFTNRTWMMNIAGAVFTNLHIKGERKNLPVNANTIGTHMPNGYVPLYDNDTNEIVVRIWKLSVNKLNPQFKDCK